MKYALIALLLFASISSNANATLVDNLHFTTDTTSNLDWLDVTKTIGFSYTEVQSGAGGWTTSGWRYATTHELISLFSTNIGTPSESFNNQNYILANSLVRLLGVTTSFNNSDGLVAIIGENYPNQISVNGLFNDNSQNLRVGIGELIAREAGIFDSVIPYMPNPTSRWVVYEDFLEDSNYRNFGSFLVRDSNNTIREPSTSILLITCLFVFGLWNFKRNTKQI